MSTEPENQQATDTDVTDLQTSPGQFLSSEREQRGLNQKEVADKLHITVHYVKAIECDAYEKLPGIIFARGYMKLYAEILEIEEAQVLSRFENFQQAQQEHEKEVICITRSKHQARNLNSALVSVVLFAGIFAGLWFWNFTTGNESDSPQGTREVAADFSDSQSPTALASNESPEPELNTEPEVPRIASSLDTDSSSDSDSLSEKLTQDVTDAIDENELPVDPVAESETVQNSGARVITISNEGDDVLRVSFSDESFIHVTDQNDNRLYRGVLQSGDVLEITDSVPFDILLENAPPTRLSLNGNEIDISDSIRIDNSARLTVGL